MVFTKAHDYAGSGLTIREAMVDHAKRFPTKARRPDHILWAGRCIKTSDVLHVCQKGIVRAEFLSAKEGVAQGFDIQFDNGWADLGCCERVPHLRTWREDQLDDVVEYPFFCRDGRLWVWNVYRMRYPGGQVVEEKWTENAGMWIEEISTTERIYHCSHGSAHPPDFDSLVFRISIYPR
jgi:hypothetical protein